MITHDSARDRRVALKDTLEADLTAADFQLSLFVAAAKSFKFDSCLQPFPADYIINGEKDITELNQALDALPALDKLTVDDLENRSVDLLYWIMCRQSGPRLRTVSTTDHDSVLAKAPCLAAFQRPHYIFEVLQQNESRSERVFRENLPHFPSCHAYHGSKVFNFYSILNYGLQQHLNKTALFGEGIYLSEELHVSQMFAPTGAGWSRSALGSHLACTALCEYIDNPAYVRSQEENQSTNIPEKYILVKNNDLVQVRYLLVYGSRRHRKPTGTIPQRITSGYPLRKSVQPLPGPYARWIRAHRSWLLAGGYFLLLLSIGMMNSSNAHYMKQMFMQKINYMRNALFKAVAEGEP
ncbi:protein mono-ADP-ribosyltransferase PARP16-like [Wyeomyia smithii]|uniref:protein mono-ADP-ribosyltransferase PARP16-like n=1 Tax=Wyeomyia smithii TaxID=174621 RepID=UPI002467AFDD|nr:protein mono-ADP-ribosyltransferase PARP16-like [Wyeomyia smithii]